MHRLVTVADLGFATAIRAACPIYDPYYIVVVGEIGIVPANAIGRRYLKVHGGASGRPFPGGNFQGLNPIRVAEVVNDF